jgi:hypothetical protein
MQGKGGGSQILPQGSTPAAPQIAQGPAPGSMPGKGGGSTSMPQGGNTGLAALFRNNQATGPAAPTTQIAPITAPVTPTIAPPPTPKPMPAAPPKVNPARQRPAWMNDLGVFGGGGGVGIYRQKKSGGWIKP